MMRSRRLGASVLLLLAAVGGLQCAALRAKQSAAGSIETQIATAAAAYRPALRKSAVDYGAASALRSVYAQRADAPLWSRAGRATEQAAGSRADRGT